MVKVDYDRDKLITLIGLATLKDRYMLESEASPQDAFKRAAEAFASDPDHAQRIYDYASKQWFMFSTPILTNGGTDRGLPVSCFLNKPGDSREGLSSHYDENIWLSSSGGGIGGDWSSIRSNGSKTSKGSKSTGIIPFIRVVDSQMLAFSQGVTRRGSYAAYLSVSHPEIIEFVGMRKPTGGDINRKCVNLHHGVSIPDSFMEIIERCVSNPDADDSWELIDPHTKKVVEVVSARELWEKILTTRVQTGEPYIFFHDTVNRGKHPLHKALGYEITQSNLCTEILEVTTEDRTACCVLSSANALYFDEWSKDPNFIGDIIEFLDNVNQFFIENSKHMPKAVAGAIGEASLGLGLMGFHSYLQSKNIPIDSPMAYGINDKIFSKMKADALERSTYLARTKGPCLDAVLCKNAGVEYDGPHPNDIRNVYLLSIAPNASSSLICGNVSPSIEPVRANVYLQKTLAGTFMIKNAILENLLESLGKNTEEVWKEILNNNGSVSTLDFLTDWQKDVFKTAFEIDQRVLVDLAAQRQKYICQSQSLNLFIPGDASVAYLHHVHFRAWKNGVKTLYYLRSSPVRRADSVSKQVELKAIGSTDCLACEG